MPDTDTTPVDKQLLQAIGTSHPELFAHPGDFIPVSIGVYDTCMGDSLGITLHRVPELLPAWLAFLGLTGADLTEHNVFDHTWTRSAHTTWHGARTQLVSYENR